MSDVNAKSIANLRPATPGDANRNPTGKNGHALRADTLKFLADLSADPTSTRFQKLLLAAYTSGIVPGPKGAADRKLLIELAAGKAKQQLDLSNPDGSFARVIAYIPDNGRFPPVPAEPGSDDEAAE
jgi:hypothetical protein